MSAVVAESSSKRNREPSESSSPPSAKRPRSMHPTSPKAHVRDVFECARLPDEKAPPAKNFLSVQAVSQVHDGPKPAAVTADTATVDTATVDTATAVTADTVTADTATADTTADTTAGMSESTLRIAAHFAQDLPFTAEANRRLVHFVRTTTLAEMRRYYDETGQVSPDYFDLFERKYGDGATYCDTTTNEKIQGYYMDVIDQLEQEGLNSEDDDELDSDT
ncbi:hypothetical protein MMC07_001124 [Pseudocyphellaria aurata]|nr:hypothetical protein [Pseudocyphellaria aurata]